MRKLVIFFILSITVLIGKGAMAQEGQIIPELGITMPPSINFATSPNPVGSGARAMGMGGAFIAVADDATAASWNPGGLIQLEKPEISWVGAYDYRKENQDIKKNNFYLNDQDFGNYSVNYASLAYPFVFFKRNLVVSLNYQRLYDLSGRVHAESLFEKLDGIQETTSHQKGRLATISPAIAVQITPKHSFGLTLNFWHHDLTNSGWSQDVNVSTEGFLAVANRVAHFTSSGWIKEDSRFNGFNLNLGMLWNINPTFTLGVVVKTPFTALVKYHHRSSLDVTIRDEYGEPKKYTIGKDFTDDLDMDMPISYGVGLAIRFTDNFSAAIDVYRTEWGEFELEKSKETERLIYIEKGVLSGKGAAVLSGKAYATTQVRTGAEYLIITKDFVIPLRGGFFYDPEPAKGAPDDFFGFSIGTGIGWKGIIFDMAYSFRFGETSTTVSKVDVNTHNFLTSLIYHF